MTSKAFVVVYININGSRVTSKIKHMNKASVTLEAWGKSYFITRRLFNKYLDDNQLEFSTIELEYQSCSITWLALPSIF